MAKKEPPKIKAIGYCRFSPRPGADKSTSNAAQAERIYNHCKAKGYELVDIIHEPDTSGAYDDNDPDPLAFYHARPRLYEAIGKMKRNMVLVVRWRDRVARSVHAQGVVRMDLAAKGAQWEATDEPNIETPEGKFMQTVYAGMAELKRWQIIIATSRGMKRNQYDRSMRMGRKDRCPFGYAPDPNDDTRLIEVPDEQLTLQLMREKANEGMGAREICRYLDSKGRARRGKTWDGAGGIVLTILKRLRERA